MVTEMWQHKASKKIPDHVLRLPATTNYETAIRVGRIDFSPTVNIPLQNTGTRSYMMLWPLKSQPFDQQTAPDLFQKRTDVVVISIAETTIRKPGRKHNLILHKYNMKLFQELVQ